MNTNQKLHSYCVILCGGRGNRLWPVSRESRPKQFQDFLHTGSSLLQQTYRRFRSVFDPDHIIVATNRAYTGLVQEQLPELPSAQILEEPVLCDTAAVFARSSFHIAALDPEAAVVFTPCDHFISGEEAFLSHIRTGLGFAHENDCLLTLGVRPTRAETQYGYIQLSDAHEKEIGPVKAFTEKPQEELARLFVESGEFYWNSGLIFSRAEVMLRTIRSALPELYSALYPACEQKLYATEAEQAFIDECYASLPRLSFEYGVLEKTSGAYVLPTSDFDWADMGSWPSLYALSDKDEDDNVSLSSCKVICKEAQGNLFALPEGTLAVVKDLNGYLISESGGVLLICKRGDEQSMRSLLGAALTQDDGERYM